MTPTVLLACVCGPSSSLSQTASPPAYPHFPASKEKAAVAEWLRRNTGLDLAQVVLVGDGAVLAIVPEPRAAADTGTGVVHLREELTSSRLSARLGGRSSTVTASFDCAASQYKLSDPLVFAGSNLLGGPGRFLDPAAWLKATPDWTFELPKVFCGVGYKRPFAGAEAEPTPAQAQPSASSPSTLRTPPARVGVYWVQAGAFPSAALAEAAWPALQDRFVSVGVGHRVEAAPKPSGLYRLLTGPFESKGAAASACEALKRSSVACFVRAVPEAAP